MRDHPGDVWVDVTALGDPTPQLLLAVDGRELEIAEARGRYLAGRIDVDELERQVEEALRQ